MNPHPPVDPRRLNSPAVVGSTLYPRSPLLRRAQLAFIDVTGSDKFDRALPKAAIFEAALRSYRWISFRKISSVTSTPAAVYQTLLARRRKNVSATDFNPQRCGRTTDARSVGEKLTLNPVEADERKGDNEIVSTAFVQIRIESVYSCL